jgi:hypothetical protein
MKIFLLTHFSCHFFLACSIFFYHRCKVHLFTTQVNAQKQKGQGTNPSAIAIDFLKVIITGIPVSPLENNCNCLLEWQCARWSFARQVFSDPVHSLLFAAFCYACMMAKFLHQGNCMSSPQKTLQIHTKHTYFTKRQGASCRRTPCMCLPFPLSSALRQERNRHKLRNLLHDASDVAPNSDPVCLNQLPISMSEEMVGRSTNPPPPPPPSSDPTCSR